MHNHRYNIDAIDDWNVGSNVQARADSNSITGILFLLTTLHVCDNMTTIGARLDLDDLGREVNMSSEVECLDVAFKIDAVFGSRQKVRGPDRVAVIGECSELSGRNKALVWSANADDFR